MFLSVYSLSLIKWIITITLRTNITMAPGVFGSLLKLINLEYRFKITYWHNQTFNVFGKVMILVNFHKLLPWIRLSLLKVSFPLVNSERIPWENLSETFSYLGLKNRNFGAHKQMKSFLHRLFWLFYTR